MHFSNNMSKGKKFVGPVLVGEYKQIVIIILIKSIIVMRIVCLIPYLVERVDAPGRDFQQQRVKGEEVVWIKLYSASDERVRSINSLLNSSVVIKVCLKFLTW